MTESLRPIPRKRALVLANLGTPEAPTPEKVREYLREFLMDPYVIDLVWPLRAALVHGVILRTRPALSAEAYSKIWTERGSPLLFHLEDLAARIGLLLGEEWFVFHAMRYGIPAFDEAVREIGSSGAQEIVFFPLYPQFSLAATESSVEAFRRSVASVLGPGRAREIQVVGAFGERPEFISAFASVARRALAGFEPDHVLFSFHGLPERQVRRAISEGKGCYRTQSFGTARALADALGLAPEKYSIGFQSRLGRTRWIEPHSDALLGQLAARGVRRLAVICPSFVADCLETLEEIAIRGRERFLSRGGVELRLVPSLNSDPEWATAVAALVLSSGSR